MLICSGLEKNIISVFSLKPRDAVCQNCFISIADMRFARCIRNGSCHVKFSFAHTSSLMSQQKAPPHCSLKATTRRRIVRGTTSVPILLTKYILSGAAPFGARPFRYNRRTCRSLTSPARCAAREPCSIRFFPTSLSFLPPVSGCIQKSSL